MTSKNLAYPSKRNRSLAPSTRFQGSKRKLLPWLRTVFEDLKFQSVVDLMAGTASVSYLLKQMGKTVTSNDYLRCNYMTATAFIQNGSHQLSDDDLRWLLGTHDCVRYSNFISDNFNGLYFTTEENKWLDKVACNIHAFNAGEQVAISTKRALALHALMQACLMKRPFNLFHRRNLYLRRAEVDRCFGNKSTWETPFDRLFWRMAIEANGYVFCNGRQNEAVNADATAFNGSATDLLYLDPPYFGDGRERRNSNYRWMYHFIEGMCRYPEWPSLLDETSSLRALAPDNHSTEVLCTCARSELKDNLKSWLRDLLSNWQNAQIVMSYKHPGLPGLWVVKRILEDTGRRVSVRKLRYSYALNRRNGCPNENLEVLFVAR